MVDYRVVVRLLFYLWKATWLLVAFRNLLLFLRYALTVWLLLWTAKYRFLLGLYYLDSITVLKVIVLVLNSFIIIVFALLFISALLTLIEESLSFLVISFNIEVTVGIQRDHVVVVFLGKSNAVIPICLVPKETDRLEHWVVIVIDRLVWVQQVWLIWQKVIRLLISMIR